MERFWSKVNITGLYSCWEWTASKTPKGHGQFFLDGKILRAHRLAYELIIGPIPEGLHIYRLCCNTECINPFHMETVKKSKRRKGQNLKTHCPKGHPRVTENLYGYGCKTCSLDRGKKYYQANKEHWDEYHRQWVTRNREKVREYARNYYWREKEKRAKTRLILV